MRVKATIDFEICSECDSMGEWLILLTNFFDEHMVGAHKIKVEQNNET